MQHFVGVVGFLLCFCLPSLQAHHSQYSYLRLEMPAENRQIIGQWEIASADLEYALSTKLASSPDSLSLEQRAHLSAYLLSRISLSDGPRSPCTTVPGTISQGKTSSYLRLVFSASCPGDTARISLGSSFMFSLDPEHRQLLEFIRQGKTQHGVMTRENPTIQLESLSWWGLFLQIVAEGMLHIFLGYDHLLFLLALLLPLFFAAASGPASSRLLKVLKYSGTFTLAHSLTLALAGLGVYSPPAVVIETAIALSISLVAANNLARWWRDSAGLIFCLGLIHGFGFANVLHELSFGGAYPLLTLFGFNLGVELGQLVVVGLWYPLFLLLGSRPRWQPLLLKGASVACGAMGLWWCVERSSGL